MEDSKLTIQIDDTKPNLKRLRGENKEAFMNVIKTFIGLAEEAADLKAPIPWFEVPGMLNDKMTFKMLTTAVMRAMFKVKDINPDHFSVLGATIHPLSRFSALKPNGSKDYSSWRRHFALDEDSDINEDSIEQIIRKMLYYMRYIDINTFGQAHMSNQMESYKALGMEAAEKLPFIPALRYQQEHFGDLAVGQFWHDIGAFKCGEVTSEIDTNWGCLACSVGAMTEFEAYRVCDTCNAGFKVKAD